MTENNLKLNREYKDALFKFIFGNEERKEYTLSLFNALNGTYYDDPSEVKLVTLEDVLFISIKNDVAFILSDTLNLYEQQSTWNPNMPLRLLSYLTKEYEKYVNENDLTLYSTKLIRLPTPKCVCFYNGKDKHEAIEILRLSDMFKGNGNVELEVTVYNLNEEQPSLKGCSALMEYSYFVNEMAKNRKKYATLELAMDVTLKEMSKEYSIYELLMKERGAVMSILETEYNEKAYGKTRYDEGYDEGVQAGIVQGMVQGIEKGLEQGLEQGKQDEKIETILTMHKKNLSAELIAECARTTVEDVEKIIATTESKTS